MPNCTPLSIFPFSCWLGLEEKSSYLHSNDSLLFRKAQWLLTISQPKKGTEIVDYLKERFWQWGDMELVHLVQGVLVERCSPEFHQELRTCTNLHWMLVSHYFYRQEWMFPSPTESSEMPLTCRENDNLSPLKAAYKNKCFCISWVLMNKTQRFTYTWSPFNSVRKKHPGC